MSNKHAINTTTSANEITKQLKSQASRKSNELRTVIIDELLGKEGFSIRKSPLYKGQLDYLKEVILADFPNINKEQISERLDITHKVAQLLLYDCMQNCEEVKK